MNSENDAKYRLKLAEGFLKEAEENLGYGQIRACVSNSQLAIENGAKAVILCFGPLGRTHNPANVLNRLVAKEEIAGDIKEFINKMIPLLEGFGEEKHILTDYGEEETYTLPWDIFDEDDAKEAVNTSRKVIDSAREVVEKIFERDE